MGGHSLANFFALGSVGMQATLRPANASTPGGLSHSPV
jgi:hypothetical protein